MRHVFVVLALLAACGGDEEARVQILLEVPAADSGGALLGDLDALEFRVSDGQDFRVTRLYPLEDGLPDELVYLGFSLGVMPAQLLAQTRPGARGAVLLHASIPPSEFGGPWPPGVPLQIHTMEDDDLGDVAEARELVGAVEGAELFLYPGDRHLFTDRGLPDYDEDAARLLLERVLAFLERAG